MSGCRHKADGRGYNSLEESEQKSSEKPVSCKGSAELEGIGNRPSRGYEGSKNLVLLVLNGIDVWRFMDERAYGHFASEEDMVFIMLLIRGNKMQCVGVIDLTVWL